MLRAIRNYRFDESDEDYNEATNSAVETIQDFVRDMKLNQEMHYLSACFEGLAANFSLALPSTLIMVE